MTLVKTQHLQHQQLLNNFPYPELRENQERALKIIAQNHDSLIFELPTGSGKTAIGYTFLKSIIQQDKNRICFYVTPTKTLVDQVKKLHPDVKIIYGRNEYPCLFYQDQGKEVNADKAPCSLLDCPYRIDPETGQTQKTDYKPCPYLKARYEAQKGGIIVCTTAFYLCSQLSTKWNKPTAIVIDETHQIAKIARSVFYYEITDYHLKKGIEKLKEVNKKQAENLNEFLLKMIRIGELKPSREPTLLEAHEIKGLIQYLKKINTQLVGKAVKKAIKKGKIDPVEDAKILKTIENVIRNIHRYIISLGYSLKAGKRNPLNYVYAYYEKEKTEKQRTQYKLVIAAYYVAPLIRSSLKNIRVLAYSATIGNHITFKFETGLDYSFYCFPSEFPAKNAKIFLPTDTPNLAYKSKKHGDMGRILRKIIKFCKEFRGHGHRSLIVVISDKERQKVLKLAKEHKLNAISYGNGLKPKDAIRIFRDQKKGDILVGTSANFSQGLDLPMQTAPIIFFLRPGFPRPNSPATQFEKRRFKSKRWSLWNWRVMIEALQVRGRNIRAAGDLGVCFFISQQFRRFIPSVLPEWLEESFEGKKEFPECVQETLKLLK